MGTGGGLLGKQNGECGKRGWGLRLGWGKLEVALECSQSSPDQVVHAGQVVQQRTQCPLPAPGPFPARPELGLPPARCAYLGRRAVGVESWGRRPPALLSRAGPGPGSWRRPQPAPSQLRALRDQQARVEEP